MPNELKMGGPRFRAIIWQFVHPAMQWRAFTYQEKVIQYVRYGQQYRRQVSHC